MRRYSLILLSTFWLQLNAMHHSPSTLDLPREIIISDEHGLVERIPTGPIAAEKELNQWMIRELLQQNKELQEQLEAQKKKWYVITAGVATTVIPLIIVGIELWNITHECEQ